MRKFVVVATAAVMVFVLAAGAMAAQVNAGISVSNTGVNSFYLAIGDYNRVPEKEVVVVRQRGIPDEELPVVFFLAAKANIDRNEIIKLRMKKWSWMRIIHRYKVDPSVFYVPVKGEIRGRHYGKAYHYYMTKPQKNWRKIKLSDDEVVNCVNLKFVSEHYGYDPDEVIKMREGGKRFVEIEKDVRVWKGKHGKKVKVKTIKVKSKHHR